MHCLCDCCIRYSVCLQARSANIKVTVHMNAGDFRDIYIAESSNVILNDCVTVTAA